MPGSQQVGGFNPVGVQRGRFGAAGARDDARKCGASGRGRIAERIPDLAAVVLIAEPEHALPTGQHIGPAHHRQGSQVLMRQPGEGRHHRSQVLLALGVPADRALVGHHPKDEVVRLWRARARWPFVGRNHFTVCCMNHHSSGNRHWAARCCN